MTEFERLLSQLEHSDDDPSLSDADALAIARRLVELDPASPAAWWALADQMSYMLESRPGNQLESDPLFAEMLAAYDHVVELDPGDAAGPYNKARFLARAGRLGEAYDAYMCAGRTELSHPSDIDWPAAWHFETATELALRAGRHDAALAAAQAAIATGGVDDDDAQALMSRLGVEPGTK